MNKSADFNLYYWCKTHPIAASAGFTVGLSLLFFLFPTIDRSFTSLFYTPGEGFAAARMRGLNDFRNLASNLSVALPVMLGLCLTLKLLYPSKPCLVSPRVSCYFLGLFLIGPGLLVNGLLKSFWGRPRPVSTQDFGGPWPFHEAWVMADHGLFNRSFTSGEAATVACLLPLALFVPREWRWQVTALVAIFVAATSLNRIAFGAHFLSDVTISIALMLLIAAVLRYLMFVRHAAHWNDEVLEARLTRLGEDGARSRAALALRLRGASVAAWQKAGALAAVSRANTNGLLTHVSTLMARAGASRLPGRQSSAVS